MGLLRKFLGSRPPPDWAAALGNLATLDRFERSLSECCTRRGLDAQIGDRHITIERAGGGSERIELAEIVRACDGYPESEWPAVMDAHFDDRELARHEQEEASRQIASLEWTAPRLCVRLCDERDLTEQMRRDFVLRESVPGITALLAVNLERSVRPVHKDEAAALGQTTDELFARAEANTPGLADAVRETIEFEQGSLVTITGDSPHVASILLIPESLSDLLGVLGLFVSVPTRHEMLVMTIDGMESLPGVQRLIVSTMERHSRGPDAISPRVMWLHDGVFREVRYEVQGKALRVMPPNEFAFAISELSMRDEAGAEPEGDSQGPAPQQREDTGV